MLITANIDVKKIDKAHLYVGKKSAYLDVVLIENKDGQDKYGNDGFVAQSVSKEARDRKERGPIIGNWKQVAQGATRTRREPAAQPATPPQDDNEHLPF